MDVHGYNARSSCGRALQGNFRTQTVRKPRASMAHADGRITRVNYHQTLRSAALPATMYCCPSMAVRVQQTRRSACRPLIRASLPKPYASDGHEGTSGTPAQAATGPASGRSYRYGTDQAFSLRLPRTGVKGRESGETSNAKLLIENEDSAAYRKADCDGKQTADIVLRYALTAPDRQNKSFLFSCHVGWTPRIGC